MALIAAKVRAFVFTGGNVTVKDTAAALVKALPRIGALSQAHAGPFIYHIGRSGRPIRMD